MAHKTEVTAQRDDVCMHTYLNHTPLDVPTASLSYDRVSHTLTCVSSGGPVNTVTWRRSGAAISSSTYQLGQSFNIATSTYHNLLAIRSGNVEDYIGSFSCTVSNSRGNSTTQTVDIYGDIL